MSRKRILYMSSNPPYRSAGLAEDGIKLFERMGYDVDFLTLYPFIGQKENQYSLLSRPLTLLFKQFREKYPWLSSFRKLYHKLLYRFIAPSNKIVRTVVRDNIFMPCENEKQPPVDTDLILKAINKHYDYIVTLFWQDMISAATLEAVYKKTKAPILCCVVDQYPYTGNCYYPSYCKEYQNECIKCPVFKDRENTNQAHMNYLYKKQVYASIPCRFTANSYVKKFILETGIVAENQIIVQSFMLDTDIFKPLDIIQCRKKFGISEKKNFIMLMRYIDPTTVGGSRKGIPNAIDAIKQFASSLSQDEKEGVLLLLIGAQVAEDFRNNIDVDIQSLDFLDRDGLIQAYSASSVFISPSLDDAGPSMVNQSMACGTPVVSFEIGTALDVVKNGETGYMAKLADNKDLAYGISSIYRQSQLEYLQMRTNTRNLALAMNSIQSAERIYEKVFKELEECRIDEPKFL